MGTGDETIAESNLINIKSALERVNDGKNFGLTVKGEDGNVKLAITTTLFVKWLLKFLLARLFQRGVSRIGRKGRQNFRVIA